MPDGVDHLRTSDGDRPRLVQDQGIGLGHRLQMGRLFEEDPALGAQPQPDKGRHRSRQRQGAGTGDDDDRDADHKGRRKVMGPEPPGGEGREGEEEDRSGEVLGEAVRQLLDLRFLAHCALQQRHEVRKGRMGEVLRRPVLHDGVDADGAADHAVAGPLVDRFALAGQARFVETPLPVDNLPVDGGLLTRLEQDDVADLDIVDIDGPAGVVFENRHLVGNMPADHVEGVRRALLAENLQELAKQDEGDDHRHRVEIGLPRLRHHDVDRVDVGEGRPGGDEDIHVDDPVADAEPRPLEEDPAAVEEHRGRQYPLGDVHDGLVLLGDPGEVARILRHGDPHDVHQAEGRHRHAEVVLLALPVGAHLLDARVVGEGVVADCPDHVDDGGELHRMVRPDDMGLVVRVVDMRLHDAVHPAQRLFVQPDAGGAVDPFDDEGDLLEAVAVGGDESVVEGGGVEIGGVLELLRRGGQRRVADAVVEGVEPLVLEKVVHPLAPLAAEVVPLILDHHRLFELQVTVVALDFRQFRISPMLCFSGCAHRGR